MRCEDALPGNPGAIDEALFLFHFVSPRLDRPDGSGVAESSIFLVEFAPSSLCSKEMFFLFHRFGLSFEKIDGRSMKASLLDGSRFFLRCPHKVEGQSLLPMRAVLEVSARSTESRALSLFFLGFSFPLRPPPKPPFPVVFLCSWFTFNEGLRGLSSISTAYGNIKLVSLAAKDDCVFAVEILTSAVGSKILWWLQPFHCLFLMTRSLYFTYRETLLRPWSSLRNYSMIKDRLSLTRNLTVLPSFSGFMLSIFAALLLCFFVMFEFCFSPGLSSLFWDCLRDPVLFVF